MLELGLRFWLSGRESLRAIVSWIRSKEPFPRLVLSVSIALVLSTIGCNDYAIGDGDDLHTKSDV